MEMSGEEIIKAPRAVVWKALNDPEILAQCIPGCEELEKDSDTSFTAKVKIKMGPIKATFKGNVALSNMDEPNSYTITGEGKGGAAGFGKGGADIRLSDTDGGTLLSYDVKASVGGKMAQIGSRLIDSTAKKLAGEFFSTFNELVSAPGEAPSAEQEPVIEEAAPTAPATGTGEESVTGTTPTPGGDEKKPGIMRPAILIPAVVIAVLIIYYLTQAA
ncbi:CoxG family protein [Sneathiella chinensis]|uniref:Carbon monoxide dehydrogenase n=1 Tax=Sneathiella chinensis TaxID=349750 RepID=A0ABQ5U758_9PROT|nr:carbon monoxide dehydrogenase subunit G [Sneathiella chinensis]GLQ07089.1 hypothetical protein GCM10007924_23100 [Sneathiella chinensis]